MQAMRERILEKLEIQALEDESLGQDWYDQQVSKVEIWLDPSAPEWRQSWTTQNAQRFFDGHPHPFFVEREDARLQALKRELNDALFVKLNSRCKGPVYEAFCQVSKPLNDPHYAEDLFYREEHFPAKAEDLIEKLLQDVKASYEESLRFLDDDREAYENALSSSGRRDIFRELASSFSENIEIRGSMSMESGLGRGNGYSYSEQSVRHEVPREIRESQDFDALYTWAKEYYKQAISFLEGI